MSSREPLWFCHECNAEMHPLMVPDPICSSCRGSFVEKMEDPADDPREFAHSGPGDLDLDGLPPPGIEAFLLSLQALMDRGIAEGRQSSSRASSESRSSGNRFTFQVRTGTGQRQHTSTRSDGRNAEPAPTMAEFLRRGPDHTTGGGAITGPMMAQYLMALLGQRNNDDRGNPVVEGRMGDYVFNQEALDQVITQLMENSNAHRPVPATEEIISNLPRNVLERKSPMLEKDCAVCKEQFQLETEDPDEQIVVTLPCQHPFHEPCILPWLKSSGTCPVCRHALVPQPEQHPPAPETSTRRNHSILNRDVSTQPDNTQEPSGILQSLLGSIVGSGRSNPSSGHRRSNSDSASQSRRGNGHFPGSWSDELD